MDNQVYIGNSLALNLTIDPIESINLQTIKNTKVIEGQELKDSLQVKYYTTDISKAETVDSSQILETTDPNTLLVLINTSNIYPGMLMLEVRMTIPSTLFNGQNRTEIARCRTGIMINR